VYVYAAKPVLLAADFCCVRATGDLQRIGAADPDEVLGIRSCVANDVVQVGVFAVNSTITGPALALGDNYLAADRSPVSEP
jgi:hypothetical protein